MYPKQTTVAMILAGGQGSRLGLLTKQMAKPAVPFGGKYRIIDFALSNMSNSHIQKVAVFTQYNARSLNEHLSSAKWWDFGRKQGGLYVFAPTITVENNSWYRGTADAIYQNLTFLKNSHEPYVVIASGDCVYKLDYNKVLEAHMESKADITVVTTTLDPEDDASRFGLMVTDENDKITEFQEKPKEPKSNLASMGIYIFNWEILKRYLIEDENDPESENDFGNNIIPALLRDGREMYAYHFDGYWKDVGTIPSLWEANMEILDPENSGINLFDNDWRIYSRNSGMTGHRIGEKAVLENSMITDGCRIDGSVKHSVLFAGVKVEAGAEIEDAVIMGGSTIKACAKVKHCIVAENVVVEKDAVVGAAPKGEEAGVAIVASGVNIGEGAVVGPKAMVSENVKGGDKVW